MSVIRFNGAVLEEGLGTAGVFYGASCVANPEQLLACFETDSGRRGKRSCSF